jgi:hypothetical protein
MNGPFSIAILNYQRLLLYIDIHILLPEVTISFKIVIYITYVFSMYSRMFLQDFDGLGYLEYSNTISMVD